VLERVRPLVRRTAEGPARLLSRLGLTPNSLTLIGLLLNVAVALVLAAGQLVLGGVLFLLANAFDTLDGTMARITGKVTRFGAFFDSTLDRYAEAVVYLGLSAWLFSEGDGLSLLAAYLAIIGSLMVSYTRARAEGLGLSGEVGWLPRPERIVLLSLGLLLHPYLLSPVLWILAVLTNVTSAQRMLHVKRQLEARESDQAAQDR
jgi:CDP-diacylglycerol---glycerol-3-phosphate 3-phosphatidyltransferase